MIFNNKCEVRYNHDKELVTLVNYPQTEDLWACDCPVVRTLG